MEVKIKAICIKSIDYKDNDSLITLASLERGKILATVRGSKKQTSRLRFSASLFCFGEYILNVSKSGKYIVTGCDLIDSFIPIREDIDKFYLASLMLEILDKNLITPNDRLILQTIKSIKALCYNEVEEVSATIEYVYRSMLISGYGFPKVECKVCGKKSELYFDETTLDFVCKTHKVNKGVLLKDSVIKGLQYVYEGEYNKLAQLDQSTKQNILYILVIYFEQISEIDIKTYKSYFDLVKGLY